jgi:hypothetical protein
VGEGYFSVRTEAKIANYPNYVVPHLPKMENCLGEFVNCAVDLMELCENCAVDNDCAGEASRRGYQ